MVPFEWQWSLLGRVGFYNHFNTLPGIPSLAGELGARFVPIYSLLKKSFRSNEVRPIAAAYELARAELGLVDHLDPITEMVARRIIEIAKTGERDPKLISERAVQELMGTSHPETK
jgi:hypothetical protein